MKKIIFTLSIVMLFAITAFGQLGSIDPDFNLGTGFGPDQWTGRCEVIVQQPDGKLLVGGQFTEFDGDPAHYIVRLNLDGTRDTSFSSQLDHSSVRAIALQDDGKIIIGGNFLTIDGISRNAIARLNSDGSLDLTFDPASGFNQEVRTIDVQTDGKIVVGGLFSTFDYVWGGSQTPAGGIARLNSDGSLDTSFDIGGFSGSTGIGQRQIHKVIVQPDGKILVAGHFSHYGGDPGLLIVRLNTDGTLDDSFNANNNFSTAFDGFYGQVYDMELLPDGKIMITGNYSGNAKGLNRLNSDGSLNTSFVVSPAISDHRGFTLAVQSDGKVLAARVYFGSSGQNFVVERYNADGALDETFPEKILNNDVKDIIVQNDGNITFVGYFNYNPMGIMRLLGDTPASIEENPQILFSLYPNPADNIVNFSNIPENSTINIIDLTGKVMYEKTASGYDESVDVSGFSGGVYLVRVENNGSITHKKLVINR